MQGCRNRKDSTGEMQSGTAWYGTARRFETTEKTRNQRREQGGKDQGRRVRRAA